ncbi:G-type lectin S-receptor-like serine/threonine-protein kinase At1g11300 [Salvia splendens]|uniref:G-type lectin S-receptor-like serine/threonine-protein kinase At1g11300 n=1 Tax=Salvia splendens TaxID=180675 RepID=UPI001C261A51|nr:G-type lectin S-receptor-like serine/threonine-protein kinase At1g11300 [Salvia splendens]
MRMKMNYHVIFFSVAILLHLIYCKGQSDPCQTSGRFNFLVTLHRVTRFQPCDAGNGSRGCVRRAALDCEGGKGDGFLTLQILTLSSQSDLWLGLQADCELRCLTNCSCLAYGLAGCRFYTHPFIDLVKFSSGSNVNIRVSKSVLERKQDSKKIIAIVVVVVGFVVICSCTYFCWKWMDKGRGKRESIQLGEINRSFEDELSEGNLEELPLFKMEMLANATSNFSEANKLGRGGFGPVYKGEMVDGTKIAVKMLSQASRQGMKEFVNEVVLISKLQHRNLVRLLGWCVESKHTIVDLCPDSSQDILDWSKRFNIICGVSRGMLYLHRDSRLKIIHCDLKPSNILLDDDWNPEISDFGIGRILGSTQDHVQTWWNLGRIESLIDRRVWSVREKGEAMRCVQELPEDRPSTSAVESMLSTEIVKLPEPKQPAFVVKSSFCETGTTYNRHPDLSRNSVSLTVVVGR